MASEVCPHEMNPSTCSTCIRGPRPRRIRPSGVGPLWVAQFPGRCPAECGRSIERGDDVRRFDGEIMHARCAERLA